MTDITSHTTITENIDYIDALNRLVEQLCLANTLAQKELVETKAELFELRTIYENHQGIIREIIKGKHHSFFAEIRDLRKRVTRYENDLAEANQTIGNLEQRLHKGNVTEKVV